MSEGSIRVLFVDHETRLSGGEQDLLDLITALGKRVDAHVALPGEGPLSKALADAGATVHLVPMSEEMLRLSRWEFPKKPWLALKYPATALFSSFRISRLIDEIQPSVVHTNSMKAHLLAALPARLGGLPLIWHVRDILEATWIRRAFAEAAWRIPTLVICISEAVRGQFEGTSAPTRSRVIYNGIDIGRFHDEGARRWRERFGGTPDEILIGIVGQIAWWKGQDLLIDAAALLKDAHPGMRFVIVGECLFPENEGEYERSLHEKVKAHSLDGRVQFAGWSDEPEAAMQALDIVVHASRLPEPFGRVIVEAMAAGRPVVASSIGAGAELVSAKEGRTIDPTNTQMLADTLLALSRDPVKLREMGEAARKKASDFDISHTADGVLDVYRELGLIAASN